ncbi:hypothetical protein BDR03DRAFT_964238 [Suillus americanus]|nr:hypothetical protein BDR03DRAFT_964238 [Suillus americanus]
MKQLAVDELQKLEIEPIEKITTYDRYNIDKSLLLPAYKLLCKRASRMSAEEGERLKMPTILGIHEARERALRSAAESGCRSPTSADAGDEELDKILIDVFNLNSHATNRQGAQSQVKPDPVPTPKPGVNGTTNGTRSSLLGSSTQNNNQQKDRDKNKGKAKLSEEPTEGGGSSTEFSISAVEKKVELAVLNFYLPTFIQSVMTVVFAYVALVV